MSLYYSFSLTWLVTLQAESSALALNLNLFLVQLHIPYSNIQMKEGDAVKLWQRRHGSRCQGLIFCDLFPSFCINAASEGAGTVPFVCRVIVTYCAAEIMQNSLRNPLWLQPCMQSCLPPPVLTASSTIHWKRERKMNTSAKLLNK